MADNNNSTKALREVKQMQRSLRLESNNDPELVSITLDNIIKETLNIRQHSGQTRLSKSALKELKTVRDSLNAGRIDVGNRTEEYLEKFNIIYEEVDEVNKSERQESRNNLKTTLSGNVKNSVGGIASRKDSVIDTLKNTNPIAGHGLQLGNDVASGALGLSKGLLGRKNKSKEPNERIASIIERSLSDERDRTQSNYTSELNSESPNSNYINLLSQKLDQIIEELRQFGSPIVSIASTTEDSSEYLEQLNDSERRANRLERLSSNTDTLEASASGYSDYLSSNDDDNDESADSKSIFGSLSSALGMGGEDGIGVGSGAFAGSAAGSMLGRAGSLAMAASRFVPALGLIVGAGYLAYKYNDEIKGKIEEFQSWVDNLLGMTPGEGEAARTAERAVRTGEANSLQSSNDREDRVNAKVDKDKEVQKERKAVDQLTKTKEKQLDLLEEYQDDLKEIEAKAQQEYNDNREVSDETRKALEEATDKVENFGSSISVINEVLNRARKSLSDLETVTYRRVSDNMRQETINEMDRKRTQGGNSAPGVRGMLDYIGEFESGGNYNRLVNSREGYDTPEEVDLTTMTIQEVQDYQKTMMASGHQSTALGKYQMIESTLKEAVDRTGLSQDALYSEENQDILGKNLLDNRGLQDYLDGNISKERFANNLAKEWAVLADSSGKSYYDDVGSNSAGVTFGETTDQLEKLKRSYQNKETENNIKEDPIKNIGPSNDSLELNNPVSNISSNGMDNLTTFENDRLSNEKLNNKQPVVVNNNNNNNMTSKGGGRSMPTGQPENTDPTWRRIRDQTRSLGIA